MRDRDRRGRDPVRLVRKGYEEAAERYDAWSSTRPDVRGLFVQRLLRDLPEAGPVVDLGCGGGLGLRHLARRRLVIGVDIARPQLELSRSRFPQASFVLGDLRSVAFRPASLAAVVCLYALFHLPREAHGDVLRGIASWLEPGTGRLLVTAGARSNPGAVDPSWLGVPMFWSSFAPEVFVELVGSAGLDPEVAEVVDEGDERHLWVIARRTRPGAEAASQGAGRG